MAIFKKPMPIIEEIVLDPSKTILSKTNPKGIIEYANDYFMEISGYDEHELIGQPHNAIRHPDMPKVIFKWLWERLQKKENIHALVKNLAKDGRYYWVITDFEVKMDDQSITTSFFARRKCPPRAAVKTISELYKKLLAIEKAQGVEVSEKYFIGFLEERNQSYDEFIEEICLFEKQKSLDLKDLQYHKRKGLFVRMFN